MYVHMFYYFYFFLFYDGTHFVLPLLSQLWYLTCVFVKYNYFYVKHSAIISTAKHSISNNLMIYSQEFTAASNGFVIDYGGRLNRLINLQ